ncbi:MAG: hypothetical protein JW863_06820 [Chitinispirillaceae bacterium]|nr:hypothetical protein [Chitinispirillaceae bacterium]
MKQQRDNLATGLNGSFRRLFVLVCIVGAALGTAAAGEENAPGGASRSKTPAPEIDSLRRAIDQLRQEAARLREKADQIDDDVDEAVIGKTADHSGSSRKDTVETAEESRQPKDTVELLSKEGTRAFLESFGRKRGSRERGYGGGIGAMPGIFVMNMRPVHQLLDAITSSSDFSEIAFPINSNLQGFFMMGITGYGALGNGLRVGGSYQSGSRSYSTREHDTTYTVDVHTSFGGFLLEKAAVTGPMNWFVGGMAGGAEIDVNPSKASNLFSTIDIRSEIGKSYNRLSAPALLLELHGGFTYTMVNWFHIGGELMTPLYFSPSGFKTSAGQSVTNGFVTVNPGFRIRIILGNIG